MFLNLKKALLHHQTVLMRVDFNVPLNDMCEIIDTTRIDAAFPTIQFILKEKAKLILISHLGRPKSFDSKYSLKPCAQYLSQLLNQEVVILDLCDELQVKKTIEDMRYGTCVMLENIRFFPAEENPDSDKEFVKKLASLGNLYVNEAFSCSHRKHSSTYEITKHFKGNAYPGFLLEKELLFLTEHIEKPKRPFFAIIGGSKISSKLHLIQKLIEKVDGFIIAGAMAFTFLKALGYHVGSSLVETGFEKTAKEIILRVKNRHIPFYLPEDAVCAQFSDLHNIQTWHLKEGIPDSWMGLDIGIHSLNTMFDLLKNGQTILWNGPLGKWETAPFDAGTISLAKHLASHPAIKIAGGGDLLAAIHKTGSRQHFNHISTGGGACLELLEKGFLPGIEILKI